jgi:hypothetical protein
MSLQQQRTHPQRLVRDALVPSQARASVSQSARTCRRNGIVTVDGGDSVGLGEDQVTEYDRVQILRAESCLSVVIRV